MSDTDLYDGITDEWLECFESAKANGSPLDESIFWRLALHTLPEGVDPDNEYVKAALAEIKASMKARGR